MAERDWNAEMRAVIDAAFNDGESVPVMAINVVSRLRQTDPELLAGWLNAQAVSLLGDEIRRIDRASRTHARQTASRSAFREAADSADPDAIRGFLTVRYVVDESHSRLPLAQMRKDHCTYVADQYAHTSRSAAFEAQFFRALAKKVRDRTVGEVFTEDQITALRQNFPLAR